MLGLVGASEVLIEGFRPGVMERLGLGPEECLARNPALVYGRMTGWGQDGRYAHTAGHDITYLAISGALHMIGEEGGKPVPPVEPARRLRRRRRLPRLRRGQRAAARAGERGRPGRRRGDRRRRRLGHRDAPRLPRLGAWKDERGVNLLDGGAPFYDTYALRRRRLGRGRRARAAVLRGAGRGAGRWATRCLTDHLDPSTWPTIRERFTAKFAERRRDEWHAALRRLRLLRRPGPLDAGGPRGRPQPRPRHLRRGRRHAAAGPGAALQRHHESDVPHPARPRGPER